MKSGKEAKRLIGENGVRFGNEPVTDPNGLVTAPMLEGGLKVSVGRKRHAIVRLRPPG